MKVLETRPTKKKTKKSDKKRVTLAAILRRREYQLTGLGHFIGYNLRKSVKQGIVSVYKRLPLVGRMKPLLVKDKRRNITGSTVVANHKRKL